jgi:hypothetical protein
LRAISCAPLQQRRLDIEADDARAELARQHDVLPADTATDIEHGQSVQIVAADRLAHILRPARRHVALAPDQLEHGNHLVVVFVVMGVAAHSSFPCMEARRAAAPIRPGFGCTIIAIGIARR